ncbi:hypothetical protein T12_620, partial [Trichinella patagoniensis]
MFPKLGKLIDKCYQCAGLEASEKDNKKFINDIPSNGSTSEKKPIQTKSSGHSKFIYNPRNPKH